jgi:hypothetical protein
MFTPHKPPSTRTVCPAALKVRFKELPPRELLLSVREESGGVVRDCASLMQDLDTRGLTWNGSVRNSIF